MEGSLDRDHWRSPVNPIKRYDCAGEKAFDPCCLESEPLLEIFSEPASFTRGIRIEENIFSLLGCLGYGGEDFMFVPDIASDSMHEEKTS
jgi:hypothetical protein